MQLDLLSRLPPLPNAKFDGSTFEPEHDQNRLNRQLRIVYLLMCDQEWRTKEEISARSGEPSESIGSRLRDLRKAKFGGHTVERRRRGDAKRGLFEYRLLVREQ